MVPNWVQNGLKSESYASFLPFAPARAGADFITRSQHHTARWALIFVFQGFFACFLFIPLDVKKHPTLPWNCLRFKSQPKLSSFSVSRHLPPSIPFSQLKCFLGACLYNGTNHIQITDHSKNNHSKEQPSNVENTSYLTFLSPSSYIFIPQSALPPSQDLRCNLWHADEASFIQLTSVECLVAYHGSHLHLKSRWSSWAPGPRSQYLTYQPDILSLRVSSL